MQFVIRAPLSWRVCDTETRGTDSASYHPVDNWAVSLEIKKLEPEAENAERFTSTPHTS